MKPKDPAAKILVMIGLMGKAPAERVLEGLKRVGYDVTLKEVREVQTNLEKFIKSPWINHPVPNQNLSSYKATALRLRGGKRKPKRPSDTKFHAYYDAHFTPHSKSVETKWLRELSDFIEYPFQRYTQMSELHKITLAIIQNKPFKSPAQHHYEYLRSVLEKNPALKRQVVAAWAARQKVTRLRIAIALSRGKLDDYHRPSASERREILGIHSNVAKMRYRAKQLQKRYKPHPGK